MDNVAKPKKPLGFFAWAGIGCSGLVAVSIVCLLAFSLTMRCKTPPADPAPEKPLIISMEELHRAFEKDQAEANKKYKGKPLLVTGKIEYVQEAVKDNSISVGLFTGNRIPAVAHFQNQKKQILALKKGEIIAFTCQVDKYSHVSLSNLHEYVPFSAKITGLIPRPILKILPDVSFVEIVHLKDCELVQWEH